VQQGNPFFQYAAHSRAYLARATSLLARFRSEEDVASIFYSALELRYGIEARLTEYLEASMRAAGRQDETSKEYVATRLLKELAEVNPEADHHSRLRLDRNGQATDLHYIPVSKRLASIHGMLGELLHYKFFANNPNWCLRSSSQSGRMVTLTDYARLLDEGIAELQRATCSTLLAPPSFRVITEPPPPEEPVERDG
jgi:hypothetical protein